MLIHHLAQLATLIEFAVDLGQCSPGRTGLTGFGAGGHFKCFALGHLFEGNGQTGVAAATAGAHEAPAFFSRSIR